MPNALLWLVKARPVDPHGSSSDVCTGRSLHVHVPKPEILEEQFVLLVEGELIEVLKHFLSRNFDLALNEVQGLDDVF